MTELNKTRYLNVLSQYRFAKRVSEEIEHFLKGQSHNLQTSAVVEDKVVHLSDKLESIELLFLATFFNDVLNEYVGKFCHMFETITFCYMVSTKRQKSWSIN